MILLLLNGLNHLLTDGLSILKGLHGHGLHIKTPGSCSLPQFRSKHHSLFIN